MPGKEIKRIIVRKGEEKDLPLLSQGEFGYSTDTKRVHIGTGTENLGLVDSDTFVVRGNAPTNPVSGLVWLDTENRELKQWTGEVWRLVINKGLENGTSIDGGSF